MRKTINPQPNLREPWLELEHARELETISSLLDAHPKLNELVLQDLKSVTPSAGSDVGRGGMSAEQVLRALLVKQLNQFSYRELAFHLADSRSYRTFCQLGIIEPTPSKSTPSSKHQSREVRNAGADQPRAGERCRGCWDRKGKKSTSGLHGSGIKHSSAYRLRASL